MTRGKKFKQTREALGLSQAQLAERLGMADGRTVRNWESGAREIPQFAIAALEVLERGPEWIIGTPPDLESAEYIVHTIYPRFIARIAIEGEDAADTQTGVRMKTTGGEILCEIIWQDPPPSGEAALVDLMLEAGTALEIYTQEALA